MPQKRDINSCNFSWRVYYWVNNNVTRMCTRFTVLHRVTPLYIYIYTHARAHFSFQFRGGGSLTCAVVGEAGGTRNSARGKSRGATPFIISCEARGWVHDNFLEAAFFISIIISAPRGCPM